MWSELRKHCPHVLVLTVEVLAVTIISAVVIAFFSQRASYVAGVVSAGLLTIVVLGGSTVMIAMLNMANPGKLLVRGLAVYFGTMGYVGFLFFGLGDSSWPGFVTFPWVSVGTILTWMIGHVLWVWRWHKDNRDLDISINSKENHETV